MKTLIAVIIFFFTLFINVSANASTYAKDAVANGLPFRTLAQLKAHCLARVEYGRITIRSAGMNPEYNVKAVAGHGDEEVIALLTKETWELEVLDSKAEVIVTLELSDSNHRYLFKDDKSTSLVANPSGLWLHDATLQRNLINNPFISVPGATDATLYITDKRTGKKEYGRLDVKDGLMEYYTIMIENTNLIGMVEITFQEDDGSLFVEKFGLDGQAGSEYKKPVVRQVNGLIKIGGADGIDDFGINPIQLIVVSPDPARVSEKLLRFETVGDSQVEISIGVDGAPILGILYRGRGPENYPWSFYPFTGIIKTTFTPGVKYDMSYVTKPSDIPPGTQTVSSTTEGIGVSPQ